MAQPLIWGKAEYILQDKFKMRREIRWEHQWEIIMQPDRIRDGGNEGVLNIILHYIER